MRFIAGMLLGGVLQGAGFFYAYLSAPHKEPTAFATCIEVRAERTGGPP